MHYYDEENPENYTPWLLGGGALVVGGLVAWALLRPKKAQAAVTSHEESEEEEQKGGESEGGYDDYPTGHEDPDIPVAGENYSPFKDKPISEWNLDLTEHLTPGADRVLGNQVQTAAQRVPVANKDLAPFDFLNSELGLFRADLRHTNAEELTFAGKLDGGEGGYLIPETQLVPNMAPTTWVLGWLADQLGYTPWVTSGYRTPTYADDYLPGAEPDSRHNWFCAVDLTIPTDRQTDEEVERFRKLAYQFYKESGALGMGLGLYDDRKYTIHIDTGGGEDRPGTWGDWEPYK